MTQRPRSRTREVPLAIAVVALIAVVAAPAASADDEDFAAPIEAAQGRDAWYGHPALSAQITGSFGGSTFLDGTLWMTPDMGGIRIEHADGTILVWDGEQAWISPAASGFREPRFHVLTWPYFLAVPFKLRDPGTRLTATGGMPFRGGERMPAARLEFAAGVGDSPDDWYVLYRDPESGRLAGMAYIVTYGPATVEEAEAEPHAIVYSDPVTVEGVTLATDWTFHLWSPERGVTGEPLGRVTLSDLRFAPPPEGAFAAPADARAVPLPDGEPPAGR